jgi:hypothetical protein
VYGAEATDAVQNLVQKAVDAKVAALVKKAVAWIVALKVEAVEQIRSGPCHDVARVGRGVSLESYRSVLDSRHFSLLFDATAPADAFSAACWSNASKRIEDGASDTSRSVWQHFGTSALMWRAPWLRYSVQTERLPLAAAGSP